MKNKKGFTLIELLAVIVILAIIALIATPIVMNVIENSRKGAAERSAENYIDAVEIAVAAARLDGPLLADGTYTLAKLEDELGTIEVSGNKPTEGSIKIKDGVVVTDPETELKVGEYTVSYDENGKIYATKKITVYSLSEDTIPLMQPINLNDTTKFATNYAALGKDYFLKLELDADNNVIASYACAKYGDDITCVRGGADANRNSYYSANKSILEDLSLVCTLGESNSSCDDGSVTLHANSDGFVGAYASGGGGGCDVGGDVYAYGADGVCSAYYDNSAYCSSH